MLETLNGIHKEINAANKQGKVANKQREAYLALKWDRIKRLQEEITLLDDKGLVEGTGKNKELLN